MADPVHPPSPTVERAAGPPIGLFIVVAGLALVALSTFALDWTEARFSDGGVPYFELPDRVLSSNSQQTIEDPSAFAIAYFSVLGLLLLVLVAVLSLTATWPGGRRGAGLRLAAIVAAVVGLIALALAVAAVARNANMLGGPSAAIVGYLALLGGVLVGAPRPRR